ncbi:MAG TPA: hypothetical protein VL025_13960, partial [Thermoanaerobaculia bacterium]|nr:hypothetical protein [Thermoanaerobaculia bacterium]
MTRIEIPALSPFFAGHFPGHPILPGIAHLALVARELGGVSFTEVRNLKLRRPVLPGDVLDVTLERGEEGLVKFELRRGEEAVSGGIVRTGEGDLAPVAISLTSGSYPPPGDLIPHAPPALLVRDMLEVTPEGASAIAWIPGDSPFVQGGRAPAFAGLEAGAQTAAVLEALGRSGEGAGPRIGYVVAIRNARFRTAWLPAEQPLAVSVKLAGSAPPLSIYEVKAGGEAELVTGLVSTYVASTPTAS